MLRNKKGFTLVELLAVIVILAIILAIAVPTISTLIANQKKSAFEAGVKMILKGADYIILQGGTLTDVEETYGAASADYTISGMTKDANGVPTATVSGTAGGQFAGCTTGTKATPAAVSFNTVAVEC